jgi:hypothetical protein
MHYFSIFLQLLKNRQAFIQDIDREIGLQTKITALLLLRTTVLRFWLCLYGFVGSELSWTLRPFFGASGQFELFRPREGNFLTAVWETVMNMVGGG